MNKYCNFTLLIIVLFWIIATLATTRRLTTLTPTPEPVNTTVFVDQASTTVQGEQLRSEGFALTYSI